ncbi:unnamed protein product [Strongylus vulgaris]|uniref:Uncharacterized protein n=1 Tax=Strongylus vulgaris TaxID=40348 RepID=A0A3P7JYX9_STRVU|nr:unnamed protein product [Strongylus vulgaris]
MPQAALPTTRYKPVSYTVAFKFEILFIGAKELCELKSASVTSEGDLKRSLIILWDFLMTTTTKWADHKHRPRKEIVTRLIRIEELGGVRAENEDRRDAETASQIHRIAHLEQILEEVLRRLPVFIFNGRLNTFTKQRTVAEIRQLKGLTMCHFALALDSEVYKDETLELEMLCSFKFYEISTHLREGTWKKTKELLNSRIRRLRKAIRDKQTARVCAEARYVSSSWQECEDASGGAADAYYFEDE